MSSPARAALAGLPLDSGLELLHEARTEFWWFARSVYLCAACDSALPTLRFQPAHGPDRLAGAPERARAVFGFRNDDAMRGWAARHSAAVAMPEPGLVTMLGDKTHLPALARDAGVMAPRSLTLRMASARDADGMWGELGAECAVAQLAGNDLTGAGTRRIGSARELAACLREWEGRAVKLAEYVEGLPLTVSGVVAGARVIVSGVSYQLVGYKALTPRWSAHCGNQLAGDDSLPSGTGASAREVCHRIGLTLAEAGFRGMFGIDVIAGSAGVMLIELNPRIQSVTSLLNAAEYSAGLLPSPLLHALAFIGAPLPPPAGSVHLPPYGQMTVSAGAGGQVIGLPEPGVYEFARPLRCARAGPAVPLGSLQPGQSLVWPLRSRGERVGAADGLYVVQLPEPVLTCPDAALTRCALQWLAALARLTRIEGGSR